MLLFLWVQTRHQLALWESRGETAAHMQRESVPAWLQDILTFHTPKSTQQGGRYWYSVRLNHPSWIQHQDKATGHRESDRLWLLGVNARNIKQVSGLGILSGILITRGSVFKWSLLYLLVNRSCSGVNASGWARSVTERKAMIKQYMSISWVKASIRPLGNVTCSLCSDSVLWAQWQKHLSSYFQGSCF